MAQVRGLVTVLLCCLSLSAVANPLERIEIKPGIYALVGPMEQRSPENLANNANFGFVVYDKGVVLIDSGGTHAGAKAIEAQIRSITDKPVTYVINTGGQDHRWFGNHYFSQQGAQTLTSLQTQQDQQTRGATEAEKTANYTVQNWLGTQPQIASRAIGAPEILLLNSPFQMDIIPVGPAHTGGETLVWLPKQKVLFSGDVVYVDRMLGVGPQSHHLAWLGAFETIQGLSPDVIVPGHGRPTDLPGAEKDTYAYLKFLRTTVGQLLEDGQDMSAASQIDQRQFSYLKVYDEIHARNALRVFEEMEWE